MSAIDTDDIRGAVIPGDPNTAVVRFLCDEVDRLRAENDQAWATLRVLKGTNERLADDMYRLRAALEEIAGGECWMTRCPDGDLCDTCTARKALGVLA